jgi:hypothetical protein
MPSSARQVPREFPSPLWGGARGGGTPDGRCSAIPPSLSLPHKGGGNARNRCRDKIAALLSALVAVSVLSVVDADAQGKRVRPAEEGPEQYPAGPNRDDTFYFCTACHSFRLVAAQGMSRERWDESLTWMVSRHNMPDVQGPERTKILDYLAAAFPERKRAPGGWKNPFEGK